MRDHANPATATAPPVHRSRFPVGVAIAVLLLCAAGFGPSLIVQSRRTAPITPLLIAHGVVTGGWLILFLVQAALVASRRTTVHRRVGWAGPVFTVAAMVLGYLTVIALTRRGFDVGGDLTRLIARPGSPTLPLAERAVGMLPPLAGLMNFGALAITGVLYRHRPAVHRRLMVLALLSLTGVPLLHLAGVLAGLWPGAQAALGLAVLIGANLIPFVVALHDRVSQRRIHPVSLWVPILLIVQVIVVQNLVQPSAAWRDLSMRLLGSGR